MKNNDPFSIHCEQEPSRAKTVQKKQTNYNMKMILNQSTVNKNPAQLIQLRIFLYSIVTEINNLVSLM